MMRYLAVAVGILFTGVAQVLLKSGVARSGSWWSSLVNWRTLVGYGLFAIVTVLNVYAMQEISLIAMGAWISSTYLLVILLSWLVLKERASGTVAAGGCLIILGIVVFHLPG